MSQDLQGIGTRLKVLRKTRGLNQAQFAEKVELRQSTISQFERDQRTPSTKALHKISKAFGLSIDDLLGSTLSAPRDEDDLIDAITFNLRKLDKKELAKLNRYISDLVDEDSPPATASPSAAACLGDSLR